MNAATVKGRSKSRTSSMRGYQCKYKTAREILETLGFDPRLAIRGWVLPRTSRRGGSETPVRMHAMIHQHDGIEYIDVHADLQGPNDTHVTVRGRRTERWNEIFEQIDHNLPCDAGRKLLEHYGNLVDALDEYHAKIAT